MEVDHVEGYKGWFMLWEDGIGHRCLGDRFRVTMPPWVYCGCGAMIPNGVRDGRQE